jgi:uncharacterized protein (TIGR01777 family)
VHIVIAGGSGFLGRALTAHLRRAGHTVATLTRTPREGATSDIHWSPDGRAGVWTASIEGAAAIVNLVGEGLADKRWTDERKRQLRSSRLLATRSLVSAIAEMRHPPAVFVSGSGVGYYGDRGSEFVTEATPPGADFLAQLCVAWEREAEQASSIARVGIVRTAPVLHPGGGALRQMLTPFRLGLGGRFGRGSQFMPWIHLDDWVRQVTWIVEAPEARGAFNACAPETVTNAEFTRTLARTLRRPAMLPVPAFALRLALGELSDALLTGQRAIPARAQELGFEFDHPALAEALADLLKHAD